ncbi:MAG: M14 family metallopeptidase [Myxococcota bacterium]|nr:M14 family metallopeptidase [Myxococcota bacterium]
MSIDPSRHFRPDYASARELFLGAAEARGARVASAALAARGRRGEELSIDSAWIGPAAPARVLVVSSGIHGAEGFAGSAIQHRLLAEQLDDLALPPDAGLLLLHAINPYGFSHVRRVNESNVDLNRNFLRHPDEHVANPDYDALYDAINPSDLEPEAEQARRARLLAFGREHGAARLQEVLSRGQYSHPRGVQFGGVREEESTRALKRLAREELRGARQVAWIDVHTGLGPWGEVEMILELAPGTPGYERARTWYGDRARSTANGESASAHLVGTVDVGMAEALDPEVELTMCAAEFGTHAPVRVFQAMRADNWLHQHGELDSEAGRAIKAELLEVFRPSEPAWRARILEGGARVLQQACNGLGG